MAMAELLISKGADLDPVGGSGMTPLERAREHRHMEIVELLRKHGAKE